MVVELAERLVNLAEQFALTIAGAQFEAVLGLAGRALGFIADVTHLVLQVADGLTRLFDQLLAPVQQFLAEILELLRAHVLLAFLWLVTLGQYHAVGCHRVKLLLVTPVFGDILTCCFYWDNFQTSFPSENEIAVL